MLGVTFDNNLNFEKHVKNITDAAKRKLACISKIVGKDWGGSTVGTREQLVCLKYGQYLHTHVMYGVHSLMKALSRHYDVLQTTWRE